MGRLIDADKLNEEFDEVITAVENSDKETISREEFLELLKILRSSIYEQPTAYDIEKVVAELEESMNDAKNLWDDDEYYTGCANAFEQAIDIVRKGGVE